MTDTIPTLAELPAKGRAIVLAYVESERASAIVRGIEIGRAEMYAAWESRAVVSAAVARSIASQPSYAALCVVRGEPDRAAAQIATLERNGVIAA
ncbi:MAG: hypothetical protein ACOH10_13725 [Rhodoglobus sp.]